MPEPLTIYECPCGVRALDQRGPHEILGSRGRDENDRVTPGTPCPHGELAAVRVFREEDVRPLWDGFRHIVSEWRYLIDDEDRSTSHPALDAFPAPADWSKA